MNPVKDGLPAVSKPREADGDEMLLIRGIEAATNAVRRGYAISPHAYNTYCTLITRVEALKAAIDHRLDMQGGKDD